jgi:dihydroorotate dehydrogenase electron transfer subunit
MSATSADRSLSKTTGAETCRILGCLAGCEPLGSMMRLEVHVPGWRPATPGQFALLQAESSSCFLARALSVCSQSGETVSFLVAPIGRGTRELCGLAKNRAVWVLGPLGVGFDVTTLTDGPGRLVLVGGGVGIAPFPLLIERLAAEVADAPRRESAMNSEVLVLAGFRDAEQARGGEVLAQSVSQASKRGLTCRYEKAVEDGSAGPADRVTDLLALHLQPGDRLAVCGPDAMSRAVWQVCSAVADVRVWFSLETNMACGVGSCHGCVIALADGSYARVCREGPVFAGEEVFGG